MRDQRRLRQAGGVVRRLIAPLALVLSFEAAGAQDDAVPLSEDEHAAWRAIGRVNVGGYNKRGICTGTLIAPDLVLTAAHCIPPRALNAERPQPVHFVAGWFRGDHAAHRTASRIDLHPRWVRSGSLRAARADLALLTLESSIDPADVAPLPLAGMPAFADDLSIIAYSNRNTAALTQSGPCTGLEVAEGLLGTTCPVRGGNSGAPVLRRGSGGWTVVAVAVAKAPGSSAFHSFAAAPASELFEAANRPAP